MLGVLLMLMTDVHAMDISGEVLLQATPQDGVMTGFGGHLGNDRLYGRVDGRGLPTGLWQGRVTGGIDWLAMTDLVDVTTGVFVGTVGDGRAVSVDPQTTGGLTLGLQADVGMLQGRYRHIHGWQADRQSFSEDEFRLGVQMLGTVQIFAQYSRLLPAESAEIVGIGGGLQVRF